MRVLLVLALIGLVAAKRRFDNYQVWFVTPLSAEEVKYVHNMQDDTELDFWAETRVVGKSVEVLIPPHRIADVQNYLSRKHIKYDVLYSNYQSEMDKEEARLTKRRDFTLDDFNTYEDIMNQLNIWADSCPAGFDCDVVSIGQSIEGRDIMQLRIERGNRQGVWIDSLIHSREWVAGSTNLNFIARLIDEYETDDTSRDLMDAYNFYFTPVMNPDGYTFTWSDDRLWRKNRRVNEGATCLGVDLNRNYAAGWDTSGGASDLACSNTFRGPSAASEPETTSVQAAMQELDLAIVISIHTAADMWLHPWGWSDAGGNCVLSDDHDDQYDVGTAAAVATMAEYGTTWTWGNTCETIYAASGITSDYGYEVGVKYSYTPELRGPGFDPGPDAIEPAYRETWSGLVALINRAAEIEGW